MIDHSSFLTAEENMSYDEDLFNQLLMDKNCFFRIYEWKKPGLTQCHKRSFPQDLKQFDHSFRLTGGGIVFHSPGDIVFSIGAELSDSYFPLHSKGLMQWVANLFSKSLLNHGFDSSFGGANSDERNIMFCSSYSNPYELYVNGEKVFGFALKKTRTHFLVQGVLHVSSSFDYFLSCSDHYHVYFTKGLQSDVSAAVLIDELVTNF